MDGADPNTPILASPEALFRWRVVSQVHADMLFGHVRAEAVSHAANTSWWTGSSLRSVSERTVYRWLKAYQERGIAGLESASRQRTSTSVVLPERFLQMLAAYKQADPRISIPETIRTARELGVLRPNERVDRTTVYRAARRMGLSVQRLKKSAKQRDVRRFAYPHRMDCILCDGKHFRAGATRAKRVALIFLDDATRLGLHVVVGTAESTELFLRGLYETVSKRGLFSIIFIDKGPGFIANDTAEVIRRLGAHLIHGETAYPQGHGKVERLHQTAFAQVLRGLDRCPDVDPDCGALELRLQHWLSERYNHAPHESLDQQTPWQRFEADAKPLRFPDSDAELRSRFIVSFDRRVSNDNVVSIDNVDYEMPRGYAGSRVTLHRRLLVDRIACLHQGRLVDLAPVDLAANARANRARPERAAAEVEHPLPPVAANIAFGADYAPVVDADGGFSDDHKESR